MIDKTALKDFIENRLEGTGHFLVDLTVSADNDIRVEIDSLENVDIDFCVRLTREIEEAFDRDAEDYELEVGSAGLTSPLRVPLQYRKNIGNDVIVTVSDGSRHKGTLVESDDEGFTVECREKVKKEGMKRPVEETVARRFAYADVRQTVYDLRF